MPAKLTNQQFLDRANQIHNGKYSYPEEYFLIDVKLKIVCPIHGCFEQTPHSHINGNGCPICGDKLARSKTRMTFVEFVDRSNQIHNFKYEYFGEYKNSHTNIEIKCPIHGVFLQTPDKHLMGRGCHECGGSVKLTKQIFIDRANLVHNSKYLYPGDYANNNILTEILCSIHGNFWQSPKAHLRGQGCPDCGAIKIGIANSKTCEQFIIDAIFVHNDKYIYFNNYKGDAVCLEIKCPIHGIFEQTPSNHLRGSGCPFCGEIKRSKVRTKNTLQFIEEAEKIHGKKYSYPDEYVGGHILIEILCLQHGLFKQSPSSHLGGHGCSKCGIGINVSKPETAWLDSLSISLESRQTTIKIGLKRIKPDAFDPTTNTIYEFYGDYWHGNPAVFNPLDENKMVKKTFGELYQKTLAREQLIKQAGYNLIYIWENDWKQSLKQTG